MTDNAGEMKRFLNFLAGLSPKTHPNSLLDPAKLELAVVRFTALQLYWVEGLGVLDKFTCTTVGITANLEDNSYLQGTATIAGNSGGTSVAFQSGHFTYWPVDTKGAWVKNYGMASCGKLVLITHTNVMTTITCDVIGLPDYRKLLKIKPHIPLNPRHERPPDDDKQQA